MAGTPFRTHSDCETAGVPLRARRAPPSPTGCAACTRSRIHDPARGRLLLARDPFGIKPLYYVQTDTLFAFASEPQALLAAGLATRAADRQRAAPNCCNSSSPPAPATIFPGILRVLPGETLVVERGAHRRPPPPRRAARGRPGADRARRGAEAARAVLLDSVTVHLRSDVPYGLFLSGGIDSSALLALMTPRDRQPGAGAHRRLGRRRRGRREPRGGAAGARHGRGMPPAGDDASAISGRLAPRIAAAIDDPTADAAVLPSWMLGRAARCGRAEGDAVRRGRRRAVRRLQPLPQAPRPLALAHPQAAHAGVFGEAPSLTGWRDGIAAAEADRGRRPLARCRRRRRWISREWLPNDLLTKLDRCLMVHGVEGRTPFLDPVVADFAFRLPDAQKAGARFGKVLLRDWLARRVSGGRRLRAQEGLQAPGRRLDGARARTCSATLVAAHPALAGVLPAPRIRAAFAEAERSAQPAWSLLFTALWYGAHVLAVPPEGDIGEVLRAASRA